MPKAHFVFTSHHNSFSVHVKNLEELSVPQIQEIELFVSSRNGIFDFNTFTFVIQKRIEFNEFVSLIKHSGIDAVFQEVVFQQKEQTRIGFGQYKGMSLSDLPDSYLVWLKGNYHGQQKDDILKEIKKRGI